MGTNLSPSLLWKARLGDKEAVNELLDKGLDIDSTDKRGRTPLMIAAGQGHTHIVVLLISRGASIDLQDADGKSALMKATICRHADIISHLIAHGANPDLADNEGWTPRSYARKHGTSSIQALFSGGTEPPGDVPDQSGTNESHLHQTQLVPSNVGHAFIPIPDERGNMGGCLVIHSGVEPAELLKPDWKSAHLTTDSLATPLGHALAAIPTVATALSARNLVQIVGSQHLLNGIANGTYTNMLASSGAFYGGVQNTATGQIVGQFQFQWAGLTLMAPLLVWQVANIIFATMHLKRINERLERIQDTVSRIETKLDINSLAGVMTACEILDEVCEKYACIGRFTEDMTSRMVHVEMQIRQNNRKSELIIDRFRQLANNVRSEKGKQGAHQAVSLLSSESDQVVQDARLLAILFREEVRAAQLALMHEMQTAPQNLRNSLRRIQEKMEKHREHVQILGAFSELKGHAEACVEEMGWFSKIWNRGLVNKVKEETRRIEDRLRELEPSREELRQQPVYLLWKEGDNLVVRRIEASDTGP